VSAPTRRCITSGGMGRGSHRKGGKVRWAVPATVRPRLHRRAEPVSTFLLSAPTGRCGTGSTRCGGRPGGKRWVVPSTVRPRLHRGGTAVSTFLVSAPTSICFTRRIIGTQQRGSGGPHQPGGNRLAVPSTVRPRLHRRAKTVSTFLLSAPTIRCFTRRTCGFNRLIQPHI